jgi:O-antigen biosynthesis protein
MLKNEEDDLIRALRENEMLAAENERLLRELRDASEKYAEIRGSLSWKITGPLRRAFDVLKPGNKALSGPVLLNDDNYRQWVSQFDKLTHADRSAIRSATAALKMRPLFSLLVVVHDDPAQAILQTIQSIRRQVYREWEICLVDDGSTAPHVARALASCGGDPRVRVSRGGHTRNEVLGMAKGEFVAYLEPGDMLAESALFEVAAELDSHPDAAILYGDEDALDKHGHRCHPRFKTGWNPDLLREQAYLGRPVFDRRDIAGKDRASIDPAHIRHVPSILCHSSVRRTMPVVRTPLQLAEPVPTVSAIIPTRDRPELLERCIDGLLNRTNYSGLEIIVVDNDSRDERTRLLFAKYPVRVIPHPGEFNWAAMNNAGARAANGEILLFLNNDTDVIEPNWLCELATHAKRTEVGAAGAKLLYADGTVQHAGIWLGPAGRVRHLLRLSDRREEGYLGQLSLTRNLSAVTGACFAIRRDLFLEMSGFDESFPVSYNDIDLCLRLIQRGYRIVWTPHAELLHLESASRGSSEWRWRKEEADFARFHAKWEKELDNDPFFNPNLDLIGEEKLALACPPRVKKAWRR